jgi:hypothetical protein
MAASWFKVLAAIRAYVEKLTKESTAKVRIATLIIPSACDILPFFKSIEPIEERNRSFL